jgi:hypothetical protein
MGKIGGAIGGYIGSVAGIILDGAIDSTQGNIRLFVLAAIVTATAYAGIMLGERLIGK